MDKFLSRQPKVTLAEWLKEKNITPSNDPVSDVMDYYAYLEVLTKSTERSTELSQQIFSIDEICTCVASFCDSPVINHLFLTNKRFARVIHSVRLCGLTDFNDAIACMDWRYMYTTLGQSKIDPESSLLSAAYQGYEINIDIPYESHRNMAVAVAKGSHMSDTRHFNLCIDFRKRCGGQSSHLKTDSDIIRACIGFGGGRGSTRIFAHLYSNALYEDMFDTCPRIGRTDLMQFMIDWEISQLYTL